MAGGVMKQLPSQNELNELLTYCSTSGHLYWNPRQSPRNFNSRDAGTKALTAKTAGGYFHGRIMGKAYYAHRVIWKMVHGVDPIHIDHINHDRSDNRLENLRSVSKIDNDRNISLGSANKSGVMGVYWNDKKGRWISEIWFCGKKKHLGSFDSFNIAVATRKDAEIRLGFHKNHGAINAAS